MESIWEEMSNYNSPMNLAGKASSGYAMAALLVGLAVMAVLLSVAMPTWSHMIRREKEEELIFRGNQYARAINQYQRKFANASPQTLDVLIEQRLLRKKFRDPMSTDEKGEFQMLYLSTRAGGPQATTGTGRGAGGISGTPVGGRGAGSGSGVGAGAGAPGAVGASYSTEPSGGIVGVASKNTGTSIKIYKEKTRYNEWQFIGMEQSQQAGPGGAAGAAPQRGGRGDDGRGGRGGGRDGGFDGFGGFGGRGRQGGDRGIGPGAGGGRGGRGL
jgi:type II secretory pathway pseudopilin PulG